MVNRLSDPIGALIDWVRTVGLEVVFGRFYGVYRAQVLSTDDPQGRGRVRVMCPAIGHSKPRHVRSDFWARVSIPGGGTGSEGTHGAKFPFAKGDGVWVMFEGGVPEHPLVIGGWWREDHDADRFRSDRVGGIRTKGGHVLVFDDDDGSVLLTRGSDGAETASSLNLDADGSVKLVDSHGQAIETRSDGTVRLVAKDGTKLVLGNGEALLETASGTKVLLDASSISTDSKQGMTVEGALFYAKTKTVRLSKGANKPVAQGDVVARKIATHVHTSAAPSSPTSPDTTPPLSPSSGLSTRVFVK